MYGLELFVDNQNTGQNSKQTTSWTRISLRLAMILLTLLIKLTKTNVPQPSSPIYPNHQYHSLLYRIKTLSIWRIDDHHDPSVAETKENMHCQRNFPGRSLPNTNITGFSSPLPYLVVNLTTTSDPFPSAPFPPTENQKLSASLADTL